MENNRHSGSDGHAAHTTTLEQWLHKLETLHPNPIDLGLERVASVASTLALIPIEAPVVTVAGTNGKGSTVAVLEALLEQSGQRTGVFTSPHLRRFNERIRVGGQEASNEEISGAFAAIEGARGAISLTYFEFAALAALWVFRSRAADVLVLEVGLGGRLDAVNIVDPTVAVITRIDLDHQGWLGDNRDTIAREKAGIMRPGIPVVIGDPEPPKTLTEYAQVVGADPVLCLGSDFEIKVDGECWRATLRGTDGEALALPVQRRGELIPGNIATALQAALVLGWSFDLAQVQAALRQARPSGRCERYQLGDNELVLDVAHNPSAVHNLVNILSLSPCKGKTICIFSAMSDKDLDAMISAAGDQFDAWFLADQSSDPRVAEAADIAAILLARGQKVQSTSEDLAQAFGRARKYLAAGDRLVVFGSFSTVAGILPLLEQDL